MEKVFNNVVQLVRLVDSDMPTLGKVSHSLCQYMHVSN